MLFSIQIPIKKVLKIDFFRAFGKSFGFGECFFLFKFQLKKYSRIDFSSFWQDLGFGECFFLLKF